MGGDMRCKLCEREFTARYRDIRELGWCKPCRKDFARRQMSNYVKLHPTMRDGDRAHCVLFAMEWAAKRARGAERKRSK